MSLENRVKEKYKSFRDNSDYPDSARSTKTNISQMRLIYKFEVSDRDFNGRSGPVVWNKIVSRTEYSKIRANSGIFGLPGFSFKDQMKWIWKITLPSQFKFFDSEFGGWYPTCSSGENRFKKHCEKVLIVFFVIFGQNLELTKNCFFKSSSTNLKLSIQSVTEEIKHVVTRKYEPKKWYELTLIALSGKFGLPGLWYRGKKI